MAQKMDMICNFHLTLHSSLVGQISIGASHLPTIPQWPQWWPMGNIFICHIIKKITKSHKINVRDFLYCVLWLLFSYTWHNFHIILRLKRTFSYSVYLITLLAHLTQANEDLTHRTCEHKHKRQMWWNCVIWGTTAVFLSLVSFSPLIFPLLFFPLSQSLCHDVFPSSNRTADPSCFLSK